MLTEVQFDRTRRLAAHLAGIALAGRHRELLAHRGRRLGLPDEGSLNRLLDAAETGDAAATRTLLRLLTTPFTGFFRHPAHFDRAAAHALEAAGRRGTARVWSAAAATGEEPWSLAITLLERAATQPPRVSVLATDIDAHALTLAERGEYGAAAMQAVSRERRDRFFVPLDNGRWGVAPGVRALVTFGPLNLADPGWSVEGPFDVIFCRNVLMYLEAGRRQAVLERLASRLAPDGLLLLDPTEHPGRAGVRVVPAGGGAYRLAPAAAVAEREI